MTETKGLVGRHKQLDDLETPCLVVDECRLNRNLQAMQDLARAQGVRLRPHIKTHRSLELARRQVALGAVGITSAKTSEAKVFVEGGFEDVRLAYPLIGDAKFSRVREMRSRSKLSFCVDSSEAARAASRFFGADAPIDVLIKVDCGYGRAGAHWDGDELLELGRVVGQSEGLRLQGVLSHGGQSYKGPSGSETSAQGLERAMREERDHTLHAAARLVSAGLVADPSRFEVSIGSTPTMSCFQNHRVDGLSVTEIRPGNYVFRDMTQVDLGAATLDDCALRVKATIVSRRMKADRVRLLIDAGRKVLTSDRRVGRPDFGVVLDSFLGRPVVGATLVELSEEHGWIEIDPAGEEGSRAERRRAGTAGADPRPDLDADRFAPGEALWVVPNHACVVVSTQSTLFISGDQALTEIGVDARGCSR